MITMETGLRIARPIDDVFAFVSDPRNLSRWNSAVQAVRRTSSGDGGDLGTTYLMERELPTGRAVNELEVVAYDPPGEFAIRTTSGPTPFTYRLRMSQAQSQTVVQVEAETELGGVATLVAPLARRAVKGGVDANLATLKRLLESPPDACP